jgi:hypothetical protein
MKVLLISTIAFLSVVNGVPTTASESSSDGRTPVLVELFTSEGCSSCPPADVLLQKLDRQPVAGEQLIVLSEHVDYWNHIGWKDPFSARFYSDRQSAYARRLGLDSVYTPQMVVDGADEFVGSDAALADSAFVKALRRPKLAVRLSAVSIGVADVLHAHLEAGGLPPSFGVREADVYIAVALNHAESQVAHGENAGRMLTHTAVVKSLVKVGTARQGQMFVQEVRLKLDSGHDARNLRLIAFVQEPGQGRVIGADQQLVSHSGTSAN